MALALPYPSLDFVPLDVLTAEEMNQIVANYTYIANQFPITMTNLASAVQTAIQNAGGITSGEVWTPRGNVFCAGVLTGSRTTIHLTIPLGQNTKNVTSVTVSSLIGRIRCPSRELLGTAGGHSVYAPWGELLGTAAGSYRESWASYVQSASVANGSVVVDLYVPNGFACENAAYTPCNNSPIVMDVATGTSLTFH